MILEERPDGQGTSEDSSRQQDDDDRSIRKVGAEEGCGSPASCPELWSAAFAAFPSWNPLPRKPAGETEAPRKGLSPRSSPMGISVAQSRSRWFP